MSDEMTFELARLQRRQQLNYQGTTLWQQRSPDIGKEEGYPAIWRVNLLAPEKRKLEWGATVGLWMLHHPELSPSWEWYAVVLIHLRPIEGVAPPEKVQPDAAYELDILAMAPDSPLPDLEQLEQTQENAKKIVGIDPPEFMVQFSELQGGDVMAFDSIERMLSLSLEVDYIMDFNVDPRAAWYRLLAYALASVSQRSGNSVN